MRFIVNGIDVYMVTDHFIDLEHGTKFREQHTISGFDVTKFASLSDNFNVIDFLTLKLPKTFLK